jgi:four helix bundle protein
MPQPLEPDKTSLSSLRLVPDELLTQANTEGRRPKEIRNVLPEPPVCDTKRAMTYERFEDLPVWKAGIQLASRIYALTGSPPFRRQYSLRDQIERAAVSVSNNVAEGFERGTFLYISRGSAGEVRSMLCLLETIPAFDDLKSEISNLKSLAEGVSRQLRAWADSLQNSPIAGQRYLNEKSQRATKTRAERDAFLKKLQRIREGKERA